jgi:threonine dehydrogenase-like Zn-dependent dehydrogenase
MRALTFHAPLDLRCEEVQGPRLEDPRDALVRVELTAVCGSDLHVYRGHEVGLDSGTVMGHEFVGEVLEVGADVGLAPGTRVVAPFTTSCGACFYCARGLTSRCTEGALFGWVVGGRGLHGAQAERVRVPLAASTLVPLPAAGAAEELLLCGDVLSTGFYCAELGEVGAGDVVVVLGCGPVGLMACLAARDRGAEAVFAVDGVAERLALAASLGAAPLDLAGDVHAAVRHATGGRGADVVLEAVGSPRATRLAWELARPGARIAAAGVHNEERFALTAGEIYDKNLTYRGGRCPARRLMADLLPRVAAGELDLGGVFSHRMALEEGRRAYELFDHKLEGCTKVLLVP